MKAITFDIKGIKCDNTACGWYDDIVDFDPDFFLNRPCPECGSNLFTAKDYKAMKRLMLYASFFNCIMRPFMPKEGKIIKIPLSMDGSGEIKVREKS